MLISTPSLRALFSTWMTILVWPVTTALRFLACLRVLNISDGLFRRCQRQTTMRRSAFTVAPTCCTRRRGWTLLTATPHTASLSLSRRPSTPMTRMATMSLYCGVCVADAWAVAAGVPSHLMCNRTLLMSRAVCSLTAQVPGAMIHVRCLECCHRSSATWLTCCHSSVLASW